MKLDFELSSVGEDDYERLATFGTPKKNVGEYDGDVDDDGDDKDEHQANIRHNFDCPIINIHNIYINYTSFKRNKWKIL